MESRIWHDREGRLVIYQRPNVWLIAWAVMDVASIFAPYKKISGITWLLGAVALTVWALLELFKGVNYFRRILGLVVLIVIMVSLFNVGL